MGFIKYEYNERIVRESIKNHNQFPTRHEFMIQELINDHVNGEQERMSDKLSDWDGESTAEILSDVLRILRLNKEAETDHYFFAKLVDDKVNQEMGQ